MKCVGVTSKQRRHCLALLALAMTPLARAQPIQKKARLGVIHWTLPASPLSQGWPEFRERLADRGWVEGRNLDVFVRSAERRKEAVSGIVDELIGLRVDVIVVAGIVAALEAKKATATIPIVVRYVFAPVEAGLVASLTHPGGNVTGGIAFPSIEADTKKVALLKDAAPFVSRVAYLSDDETLSADRLNPAGLNRDLIPNTTVEAARKLGITMMRWAVDTPAQLEQAFVEVKRQKIDGLHVDTARHFERIIEFARLQRLPAIYNYYAVESGGLMSYNPGSDAAQIATFVDRILRGARPGDLPMELPKEYILSLNLKAARQIGLVIPATLRLQAARVIE